MEPKEDNDDDEWVLFHAATLFVVHILSDCFLTINL